jgi:hypothetical protein
MPRATPRKNGIRPRNGLKNETEGDPGDSQPDFKHYAIMGALMGGPLLLVVIVALAVYGGRSRDANAGPGTGERTKVSENPALTQRQLMEKQITAKVQRLIGDARLLHQRSGRATRKFYNEDEPKAKMAAFREAERLLRDAQNKLDEAMRQDRFSRNDTAIQDMKVLVDRDLHNIQKDKPLYLGD